MSLAPGTKLGPYEVIAPLGAGGMGEVYRAMDTRLGRAVAIKALHTLSATDPERIARFEREAQLLASLNHPHIAQIYGVEAANGERYLILEFVDGRTLGDVIHDSAMTVADAMAVARQLADALAAAHERGIIHRDLKPGNVMLGADGAVKVLDFGLGKSVDAGSGGSTIENANSPTMTMAATQAGLILGTAGYMSPEQAKGRPADKRSDVWAFGCVLFEMLAGTRAFQGEDITDTIAAIVRGEPNWAALPSSVPAGVRQLIERCLVKNRADRLADMSVVKFILAERLDAAGSATTPSGAIPAPLLPASSSTAARGSRGLVIVTALLAVGLLASLGALWLRGSEAVGPKTAWATIEAPAGYAFGEDDNVFALPSRNPVVFLPDGQGVVMLVRPFEDPANPAKPRPTQLFYRPLDRKELRPIAGTEDARAPFVSPDGRWVGFWAADALRKVPIDGGPVVTISAMRAATLGPFGAAWGTDDTIVYGDVATGRIMRVAAAGGEPAPVTPAPSASSRRRYVSPIFLPDGKRILYTDASTQRAEDTKIMLQSLEGGAPALVIDQAASPHLLSSGTLVFNRSSTLMAVPFDTTRGTTNGTPAIALTDVMQSALMRRAGVINTTVGLFDVSANGDLSAIRAGLAPVPKGHPVWIDAAGQHQASPDQGMPKGMSYNARISPDGTRALVTMLASSGPEVWIVDWKRNVWLPCGSCDAELGVAVWDPSGTRVLFGNGGSLIDLPVDATAGRTVIQERDRSLVPVTWLPDGRIVYLSSPNLIDYEVKILSPGETSGKTLLGLGEGIGPDVSKDGKWLAFHAVPRQGTLNEVFVQAIGGGARVQVSSGGAYNAAWSADGRTLYFIDSPTRRDGLTRSSQLFTVDIRLVNGAPVVGTIRPAFGGNSAGGTKGLGGCNPVRCYDVDARSRILGRSDPSAAELEPVTKIDLVINWAASLGKK